MFPKGIPAFLDDIDGDFDVFGVDWSTPMALAKEKLGDRYVLQGIWNHVVCTQKRLSKSVLVHFARR